MSLTEEAKNKSPDAFDQLMQTQLQRMYRIAISMLQNEEDAADAIQETVLRCWEKIGQLKNDDYFQTWLTRILINQCKDILRSRKRLVFTDEIPEMLFSHGCTDLDYDDQCNRRNYVYTYKDGKAVLLAPGDNTIDDFYGYEKPFSYVERKGMVYCDYNYIYDFSTYDNETDMIDSVKDKMSRMDTWDFDTMTCTSSNANIEMLHAVYNNTEEEYSDADFRYEYYVNVSDIIRDEITGQVREIIGEKADRKTYEANERSLWKEEQITALSVNDFDKIYSDDNLAVALAKCYLKIR